MFFIPRIQARLVPHKGLEILAGEKSICVMPNKTDGFEVSFFEEDQRLTVAFEGWRSHFEKTDFHSALDCFMSGLSGKSRIRVISHGSVDNRWILETRQNGEWIASSGKRKWFYPFWKKSGERILYNGE